MRSNVFKILYLTIIAVGLVAFVCFDIWISPLSNVYIITLIVACAENDVLMRVFFSLFLVESVIIPVSLLLVLSKKDKVKVLFFWVLILMICIDIIVNVVLLSTSDSNTEIFNQTLAIVFDLGFSGVLYFVVKDRKDSGRLA